MGNSLQIIIVLYKARLEDCESYRTLMRNVGRLCVSWHLMLYNNSADIQIPQGDYKLIVPAENRMLAGAYNEALNESRLNNCEWLLLLDQDTQITESYIDSLNHFFMSGAMVAVAFPILENNGLHLSPHTYCLPLGPWFFMKKLNNHGVVEGCVSAFNSASLFSVSEIEKIGGFPNEFPLDMLDTCVFYRLSKKKKSFFVLNSVLQHDLSVLDYASKMNKNRYLSLVRAEKRMAVQMGIVACVALKIRLFLRFVKQLLVPSKRPYSLCTLKAFFSRL